MSLESILSRQHLSEKGKNFDNCIVIPQISFGNNVIAADTLTMGNLKVNIDDVCDEIKSSNVFGKLRFELLDTCVGKANSLIIKSYKNNLDAVTNVLDSNEVSYVGPYRLFDIDTNISSWNNKLNDISTYRDPFLSLLSVKSAMGSSEFMKWLKEYENDKSLKNEKWLTAYNHGVIEHVFSNKTAMNSITFETYLKDQFDVFNGCYFHIIKKILTNKIDCVKMRTVVYPDSDRLDLTFYVTCESNRDITHMCGVLIKIFKKEKVEKFKLATTKNGNHCDSRMSRRLKTKQNKC